MSYLEYQVLSLMLCLVMFNMLETSVKLFGLIIKSLAFFKEKP